MDDSLPRRSPGSHRFYEPDNLKALLAFSDQLRTYVNTLKRNAKVLADSPVGLGLASNPTLANEVVDHISSPKLQRAVRTWFNHFGDLQWHAVISTPGFSAKAPVDEVDEAGDDGPVPMEAVEEKTPAPSQVKSARGAKRARAK